MKEDDENDDYLDEGSHAHIHSDVGGVGGVGDVALLLVVVVALLLLLTLVLGGVGGVTLLVVRVETLLHLVILNLFNLFYLVNTPLACSCNLKEYVIFFFAGRCSTKCVKIQNFTCSRP